MIDFLAGAIPILGALFAAGSVLVERSRGAWEHRVRTRISKRYRQPIDATVTERLAPLQKGSPEWHTERTRGADTEKRMLAAHGIDPKAPSYSEQRVASSMKATVMPAGEAVRQWVLLVSSAIGIVLLAIGQASE